MRVRSRVALIALVVLAVAAAHAQPRPDMGGPGMVGGGPPGPPSFLNQVFPPAVVMQHQQEIGLRPTQADAIKKAMTEAQAQLVDLQWELEAESEALGKLLEADHVDENAVLAKLAKVTSVEQQVKKVNFTLLVRIKNQLDPEQQVKLRAVRRSGPPGPGAPPPS